VKNLIQQLTYCLLLGILSFTTTVSAQTKIYWANEGITAGIYRANLDGSNPEYLVDLSAVGAAFGIAVDFIGFKIYWTDFVRNMVQRADLDGNNIENLIISGTPNPFGIAVDPISGKMYWLDTGNNNINRADFNGSNVEELVTGLEHPIGIVLDLIAGKMYWTDATFEKVQRANLDGSNIEDLLPSLTDTVIVPKGIALDHDNGKMYWAEDRGGFDPIIRRANFDGSNVEEVVNNISAPGLTSPQGVAVYNGKLYWTDRSTGKIQRANLDGSNTEDLFTGGGVPSLITVFQSEDPTDVEDDIALIPSNFVLQQNFPNPFNPSTTIKFSIPSESFTTLKVYDILGNEIAELVNEQLAAGNYKFNFAADNLSSGVYFYTIHAGEFTETKKMMLLR